MTTVLPRYIVLKPSANSPTYVNRNNDGSIAFLERSAFSPVVKIEAERAQINSRYVHLRFDYSNRYWQKSPNNNNLVAVSTKTEEDISKLESCTLFEPTVSGSSVSFTHVPTGFQVVLNSTSTTFQVMMTTRSNPIVFTDWSALVKLPKHIALKADNEKYLMAYGFKGYNHLRFGSDDYNNEYSGHEVELMDDGHVRLKSDYWGKYWNTHDSNWILAAVSPGGPPGALDTLFWPIKIDDDTIALKSATKNKFCRRLSYDDKDDCLCADRSTMAADTRFKVQELVAQRRIYNVRYRMEDARIYNETPYVAGTTYGINRSDKEMPIEVSVTYTKEKSYSFSTSLSITAGIATTIEAGVPGIVSGSVEISFQISVGLEWNTTTTTTESVTSTGSVTLPPMSRGAISYVGTRAACDVPFSYTYQDTSSVDGTIMENEAIDGVFNGINAYNFTFVVQNITPI